ncbi:hypothetical protein U2F10_01695 [Leptothoe sp. EHU-05/26/07-4]
MGIRIIKAKDGCIIFFPFRKQSKNFPKVISGPQKTRRRWGEEWVQLSTSLVTLEVRQEGDSAFNLGNDLRCDVVARIQTQIDESNLEKSLPKLVEKLRCATIKDTQSVITDKIFRDRLNSRFCAAVAQTLSQADYLKLLEEPEHHNQLNKIFKEKSIAFLTECGFSIISSEIRVRPLDPGILGTEQRITEKWIELEKVHASLEAQKESAIEEQKEKRKNAAALRALETEKALKQIEIKHKEAELENVQQLSQIEKDIENEKNAKERALAEIRRELEEYFRNRQKQDEEYQQKQAIQEILNQQKLQQIKEQKEHEFEKEQIAYENEVRQEKLKTLEQELELAKSQLELAKLETDLQKIQGIAEAQIIEARLKASESLQREKAIAAIRVLEKLVETLPDITSHIPVDTSGDRTIVQIGSDVDPNSLNGGIGILGLLMMPTIKKLLSQLSDDTSNTLLDSSLADSLVKTLEKDESLQEKSPYPVQDYVEEV